MGSWTFVPKTNAGEEEGALQTDIVGWGQVRQEKGELMGRKPQGR